MLANIFTPHPRGGEFGYEEFNNELTLNGMEIVRIKRIDELAIFGVGRKR